MKAMIALVLGLTMMASVSCGPNAEEVEKMRQDSIQQAEAQHAAEQAYQDSVEAAAAAVADTLATDSIPAE